MLRKPIAIDETDFPVFVHPLLQGARLYDSSCSPEARVFYIDKDGGYYLKRSPKGTLEREARLTRYFHTLGLGAEVLDYRSLACDWLLTARMVGEDLTHPDHLANPVWLCDTLAESLRMLHDLPYGDCPVSDHTAHYLATAEANYRRGLFDPSFGGIPSLTPHEAWQRVVEGHSLLQNDTLLHGDYCLPNIMVEGRRLSGFLDLGNGGVGDRHVDLFWGAWTLAFNLKTHRYRQRFLDAYGRDRIDLERLALVGIIETFG
ncbi:MAG: aminoglycoside 3'-phosphotransferase [Clostridia bacterium]|nr:aminoglycoside 3'-phosphotransferase [Clostridia bacterium]